MGETECPFACEFLVRSASETTSGSTREEVIKAVSRNASCRFHQPFRRHPQSRRSGRRAPESAGSAHAEAWGEVPVVFRRRGILACLLDNFFDPLILRSANFMKRIIKAIGLSTFLGLMHCNERHANTPESDGKKPISENVTFLTEVATESAIQVVRFSIKDGKGLTRMEDPRFTMIHDPDKGLYILDHKLKKVQHSPPPNIPVRKPDSEATDHERMQYDIVEQSAKMAYTGKEKMIGKWQCREYVFWDSYGTGIPPHLESSIIAWIADDFENGKALQKRKMDVAPLPLLSQFSKISGKPIQFPGFAIQIISRQAGELPTITTFQGISDDPLNQADFEIPADYTSVDE